MQRQQTFLAFVLAKLVLLAALPLYAQDWRGGGPPPRMERLPPVMEAPIYAVENTLFDPGPAEPSDDAPVRDRIVADDGPMGNKRSPFSARAYWLPSQNLGNQPGDWGQSGSQLSLAAPIYLTEGGNIWLVTGNVERMEISTSAMLPDSRLPVPDELWNLNIGMMHFRELDNGWRTGSILTVGSASDQPFAGLRDMTATAIAFLNLPTGERDAWNFSLFYSPTSQLPFPIPGVAYVWRPSDELTANIGIPFSLQYCPTENFSLAVSYMPLTNVNILAKQQLGERWSLYGGYQVTNDTYWLANRSDDHERLYLFDQRLSLGLERKLWRGFSVDFSAAYVFDRQVFQASSFSGDRRDELSIDPGVAGVLRLMWSR